MPILKRILLMVTIIAMIFCTVMPLATAEETVNIYAPDGRCATVAARDAEAYKAVGWYTRPVAAMYSADGRCIVVSTSEIQAYKTVGWYTVPVTVMYAPDGRSTVVATSEVQAYTAVGWYTIPVTRMYARDGRTIIIDSTETEAYRSVGWYTESEHNAYFFYPTDVISEKLPKFDLVTGCPLWDTDYSQMKYYSKSTPTYKYIANADNAAVYRNILTQYGWESVSFGNYAYETKIVNNKIKRVATSVLEVYENGKTRLSLVISFKNGTVSVRCYQY